MSSRHRGVRHVETGVLKQHRQGDRVPVLRRLFPIIDQQVLRGDCLCGLERLEIRSDRQETADRSAVVSVAAVARPLRREGLDLLEGSDRRLQGGRRAECACSDLKHAEIRSGFCSDPPAICHRISGRRRARFQRLDA